MNHRLWRLATALAIALVICTAPSISLGYSWTGNFFYNTEIADGTLSICFGANQQDGLFINRAGMANVVYTMWRTPVVLDITSVGACDAHPEADIHVIWGNCGNANAIACTGSVGHGYSSIGILVNTGYNNLYPRYYGLNPVPDGDADMPTVMAHEVGHALGSGHSSQSTNPPYLAPTDENDGPNLMSTHGPTGGGGCHSSVGDQIYQLSRDDVWMVQQRYPGLTRKSGSWGWTALCVE